MKICKCGKPTRRHVCPQCERKASKPRRDPRREKLDQCLQGWVMETQGNEKIPTQVADIYAGEMERKLVALGSEHLDLIHALLNPQNQELLDRLYGAHVRAAEKAWNTYKV